MCGLRLVVLGAALATAGCHATPSNSATRLAGGLTVQFRTEPDPPRSGQSGNYVIGVRDANGPVGGAMVLLQVVSRPRNQKGPNAAAPEVFRGSGRYQASGLAVGLAGEWEAEVTISEPRHGVVKTSFPFKVIE
jgi:hypothetical protein